MSFNKVCFMFVIVFFMRASSGLSQSPDVESDINQTVDSPPNPALIPKTSQPLSIDRLKAIAKTINDKRGLTSETFEVAQSDIEGEDEIETEDSYLVRLWKEPKYLAPLIGLYAAEGLIAHSYYTKMHRIERTWTPRLHAANAITPTLETASDAFLVAEESYLNAIAAHQDDFISGTGFPELSAEFKKRLPRAAIQQRRLRQGRQIGHKAIESVESAYQKMMNAFHAWAAEVEIVIPQVEKDLAMILAKEEIIRTTNKPKSPVSQLPRPDYFGEEKLTEVSDASQNTSKGFYKKSGGTAKKALKGSASILGKGVTIAQRKLIDATVATSQKMGLLQTPLINDNLINSPNLHGYFLNELSELEKIKNVDATAASRPILSQAKMSSVYSNFNTRVNELERMSKQALRFKKFPNSLARKAAIFAAITLPIVIYASHHNIVTAAQTEAHLVGLAATRDKQERILNTLFNIDGARLQYKEIYQAWLEHPQLGKKDIPFPLNRPDLIDDDDDQFVQVFIPMVIYAQLHTLESRADKSRTVGEKILNSKSFYTSLLTLLFEWGRGVTDNQLLKNIPWQLSTEEAAKFKEPPATIVEIIRSLSENLTRDIQPSSLAQ